MENINALEKERVVRNNIQEMEEWEYTFSFGEPTKTGQKVRHKKYDGNGNTVYDWNQNLSELTFAYDEKGRRTGETLNYFRGDPPQEVRFTYDDKGNLVERTKTNCMQGGASCRDVFEYDANKRKVKELNYIGDNLNTKYGYRYDPKGHCVEVIAFARDGSSKVGNHYKYVSVGPRTEKTTYYEGKLTATEVVVRDAHGRLLEESITTPQSFYNNKPLNPEIHKKATYQYGKGDLPVQKKDGYQYGAKLSVTTAYYTYDASGYLTQEKSVNQDGKSAMTTYRYSDGNLVEILRTGFSGEPIGLKRFTYTLVAK